MDILEELIRITLGDVPALTIYMAYVQSSDIATLKIRGRRFLEFAHWASEIQDFSWDYTVLSRYSSFLSQKNSPSTVSQKISMIRQFILSAESAGLISKCVYYNKRGRKPKHPETQLVYVGSPKHEDLGEIQLKTSKRCKKTYLMDLFGLTSPFNQSTLHKAYKQVALLVHPDHAGGSHKAFCACKEAFDFLADTQNRNDYLKYINGVKFEGSSYIKTFSKNIFSCMGGISALRASI